MGFALGSGFFIDESEEERSLRLNFACQTDETISKGIERVGKVLESFMEVCTAGEAFSGNICSLSPAYR